MTASDASRSHDPTADVVVPGIDEGRAAVVPLVAETLEVETEARRVGAVRVRVEVDQADERVGTDLVHEQVRHTVRPIGAPASERVDPYRDGDDVVIPIYEERVVVERRLFLKEEVRLSRVRHVEHRESLVPVRRERAVFERQQPDGTWRPIAVDPGAPVADATSSSSGRTATE